MRTLGFADLQDRQCLIHPAAPNDLVDGTQIANQQDASRLKPAATGTPTGAVQLVQQERREQVRERLELERPEREQVQERPVEERPEQEPVRERPSQRRALIRGAHPALRSTLPGSLSGDDEAPHGDC